MVQQQLVVAAWLLDIRAVQEQGLPSPAADVEKLALGAPASMEHVEVHAGEQWQGIGKAVLN